MQMQATRDIAVRLHKQGILEILQKGSPIDVSKPIRGPIRLRLCACQVHFKHETGTQSMTPV